MPHEQSQDINFKRGLSKEMEYVCSGEIYVNHPIT